MSPGEMVLPDVVVAMLLGWLGAAVVLVVIRVLLVLFVFCMALVPSLGRELVLWCCLAEVAIAGA